MDLLKGAGERVRELWRWPSVRRLLLVAVGITVIISLFEIRLDPLAMVQEVVGNLITSLIITLLTATIVAAVGVWELSKDWKRSVLLLVLLPLGGVLGGLLAWGVNWLVLPFHISHPGIYLIIVGSLALVFGLAIVAYETVSHRLEEAVSRLAARDVREQTLLRLKTEAELDALRAKVNPHFLFNTLNSIASLIPSDPERAEKTVQRLSNLLRYVLSAGERSFVTLDEELDIVTEYLEIETAAAGGETRLRCRPR